MGELFERHNSSGLNGLPLSGSSHYDAGDAEWQDCGSLGFWIKPLLEDRQAGLRTWLMKVDPGAHAPMHAHDEVEQIYVLEGSFYDQTHAYGAGEFIVRDAGVRHSAGSVDGALVMLFYSPADTQRDFQLGATNESKSE